MSLIEPLLTANDVKRILNCSLPQVYKLVDCGKLHIIDIAAANSSEKKKKAVRFTRSEIQRFIEDNTSH
jgi:hypothetical protein